ncbi:hypothetical protein ABI59_20580 [Acidobacteria bacterium Mor1]|nr:hypothetical protein ABI59_20580 [Acidobacteria bacterium Mor1]
MSDPRHYQIAVLGSLLAYGCLALDFAVGWHQIVTLVLVALGTQMLASRWVDIPFDWRSPLISSLSLCLLLRTETASATVLAAVITIASKFLIRLRGKHVFNPTNFGLIAILLLDAGWVSPGQWGSAALAAFAFAGLGGLVVFRARRADVTWAFLLFYPALLLARAIWLGDPMAIPLHQLQSGALLLFAFFMISDPKTTPDRRSGRILFALLVALTAGFIRFVLFQPNELLWALVCCSMLTPLIDRMLPAERYRWQTAIPPLSDSDPTAFRVQPKGVLAS